MKDDNKKPLVVLEMANNHMGDVTHGKALISALTEVVEPFRSKFDFSVKFQFRQLDTFIHRDYKGSDLKFVKRFEETTLTKSQWDELISHGRENQFLLIITPFDELSVERALNYNVDILKIASCSLADWPLLESVSDAKKDVIFSTAGANLGSIDNMVSFFSNRNINTTLMHCVGLYPTPFEQLNIGQIAYYSKRYPEIRVGYSTHEDPSLTETGAIAFALGAKVFEKHVALQTAEYDKNDYSATPDQLKLWLEALERAVVSIGQARDKVQNQENEILSLRDLQRAMFVKNDVDAGLNLSEDDVYFAIPYKNGGYVANDFSKYSKFVTTKPIKADQAVDQDNCTVEDLRKDILEAVNDISAFVKKSGVAIPEGSILEVSHHYGIENFRKTGLAMATIINEEYCKKVLVMLPGQSHPEQFHKKKKETFHVVFGTVDIQLDGESSSIKTGDVVTITPEVRHAFSTHGGCVIEEISSTHYVDDSYYTDPSIAENQDRKTFVSFWM
ncbi:MAG: N-acetylneuraminate synthase family protein [Pseudomonadota bacterium]|nr:N-acetylneuraminate synthase family protein [Pseudomonadota bacterium]